MRLLQEKTPSGPERRTALARLTDDWLAALFAAAAPPQGVALVAVGGYGRAELSPRSDLDLLLLHDGSAPQEAVAALADRLWYPVWDLGIALDHSVRTPAQARATAAEDLKVQLGLLDARPLAGDTALAAALRSTVLADWRNQAVRRLPELAELCRDRAERAGELRFLLEPDLKEARGGLRDVQALRAVAASWLADAPRDGLDTARRRLLDARDALHLATGRATDRLALQEQDAVAAELGLLDADTLLREVYEAAGIVTYASDVTWREVGRVLKARSARPRLRTLLGGRAGERKQPVERTPLAEGVVEMDGEAVLALSARPERDPALPLRAAAAAAQHGLPLSPHAVRRLATTAKALPVPWPAEAREALVTLLGAGAPAVPVWEALEAEGLVTRLLPDWERVRHRPQRNPVHTWTVDRHLVETAVRAADLRAVELPAELGPGPGSVLVLDWRVAAEYGSLPQGHRLRADLLRALDGTLDIPARLAEREAAYPRRRGVQAPPPRVTVAPAESRLATVLEVRAQDAPGLLHRIGRALEGAAVRVRSAHVSTLGANAVDTLYVTRPDGSLLPDEEAVDLARTLEAALG
ncbi:[protein-PII] uridylyltransferase family protein [Streptomyces hydrogenans]|uniref:[protein-PII] uridylyltransferase family protein n=1 Tax=Streptomyces hydrogenans TaxID=1873719 RepID=UPI0035DBAD96